MRLTRLVPALASVLAATAAAAAGAGDAAPQATFLSPEQLATAGGESYTYQVRFLFDCERTRCRGC